ncbi:MSHA pilin protein mshA [Vibrio sp. JCM 19236]|nr:MSHA pilin protein mshA [Vibrio sp. JCM 19236]
MKIKKGFTLIEFVIALVILAILSAIAAPRFIKLKHDARSNTMQSVGATLSSLNHMLIGLAAVDGLEREQTTTLLIEGRDIQLQYGNLGVAKTSDITAQDISHVTFLETESLKRVSEKAGNEFGIVVFPKQQFFVTHPGMSVLDDCFVEYFPATSPTLSAELNVVVSGC